MSDSELVWPSTLPRCTSPAIALANLDAQIANLTRLCSHGPDVQSGIMLADARVARYGVAGDPTDLAAADQVTADLARHTFAEGRVWLARARVSTAGHRLAQARDALECAARYGAADVAVAEERAEILEACGEVGAALELRLAHMDEAGQLPAPDPRQRGRLACLYLANGDAPLARTALVRSLREYRMPSPLPLTALLYNWGHTCEHVGRTQAATQAYRAVLGYLPTHVKARRALASLNLTRPGNDPQESHHAHDHHDRRRRDLLQGLGLGPAHRL